VKWKQTVCQQQFHSSWPAVRWVVVAVAQEQPFVLIVAAALLDKQRHCKLHIVHMVHHHWLHKLPHMLDNLLRYFIFIFGY
jgi:hypothetical protein